MTDIAVSTGGFTPELWSEKININLDDYGAYNDIVNRKYEGEIKQKGDKVYYYTLGSFETEKYNPDATGFTGLVYKDPKGVRDALEITEADTIQFKVGDIKKVQANIELVNNFTKHMAVAFSNSKDKFIHDKAVAGAGTKLHTDSALSLTKDNVWAELCVLQRVLTRKNAITKNGLDYQGKRPALIITPEFQQIMNQSPNYFANAFGNNVLRTGQIGHIGIFDVFLDTNIKTDKTGTGTGTAYSQTILAMTSDAFTFAEQVTETEKLRDKSEYGDFVRSLRVYGGKVVNPDCIVSTKYTFDGLGIVSGEVAA